MNDWEAKCQDSKTNTICIEYDDRAHGSYRMYFGSNECLNVFQSNKTETNFAEVTSYIKLIFDTFISRKWTISHYEERLNKEINHLQEIINSHDKPTDYIHMYCKIYYDTKINKYEMMCIAMFTECKLVKSSKCVIV